MNAKTNKIYPFIKYSFLKRLLIILLVIIIAFTSSFKPKEVKAVVPVIAGIAAVAGIVLTVTGIAVNATVLSDWFSNKKGMNEEDVVDYFNNNISVDGDGNYIFTDDATMVINDFLTDYNDSVTMVYRYPVKSTSVSAEGFRNKIMYDYFQKILLNYSDCYAFFLTINGESTGVSMRGWPVTDLSGSEYKLPYDSTVDGAIRVNIIPRAFAGVSNYLDLASASTTLYNDNWEKLFYPRSFWILPSGKIYTYSSAKILGYGSSFKELDIDNLPSYDDLETDLYWSWYGTSWATFSEPNHSCSLSVGCLYSASSDPINVYKTEADMKKDIGSQVIGSYTPDYTGTPNFNITQTDIDNCVNNYYPSDPDDDPGGGSVSDDSGGSGSGGSGIIDGLGKLFGAIGNIIDKLFGFVLGLLSKVVDFFGSILEMFTDTLTKLIDIIPTGFNEFLAALFPYIPEEMITIAQFIMLVSAIGCVVALFKR